MKVHDHYSPKVLELGTFLLRKDLHKFTVKEAIAVKNQQNIFQTI